jgi:hypothetical protein
MLTGLMNEQAGMGMDGKAVSRDQECRVCANLLLFSFIHPD